MPSVAVLSFSNRLHRLSIGWRVSSDTFDKSYADVFPVFCRTRVWFEGRQVLLPCGGVESVCRGATELFPSLVCWGRCTTPPGHCLFWQLPYTHSQVAGGKVRLIIQLSLTYWLNVFKASVVARRWRWLKRLSIFSAGRNGKVIIFLTYSYVPRSLLYASWRPSSCTKKKMKKG